MRINHRDDKGGEKGSSKRSPAPPSSWAVRFLEVTELKFNSRYAGKEIRLSTSKLETERVSNDRGLAPPSSRAVRFLEVTELRFESIDTRKEIRLSTSKLETEGVLKERSPASPSSRAACFPEMTKLRFESIDTGKDICLSTSKFENIDEATRAWQEGQARVHKGKGFKRARLGFPLQPGRALP